jgi:hypothetical protein
MLHITVQTDTSHGFISIYLITFLPVESVHREVSTMPSYIYQK